MNLIKNIFVFPALFLHEICHIFIGLLFGLKINKIHFSSLKDKEIHGFIMFGGNGLAKSKTSEFFVSFSPFLILITSIVLLFVSLNTLPIFIYVLITAKINVPSKQDFIRFFFYNELVKIHNSFDDDNFLIEDDFLELTITEIIKKNIKNTTKEKLSKII